MARTNDYAAKSGTTKAPELAQDFVDGLTFTVVTSVSTATISGGNFTLETAATLTGWPSSGWLCINGQLFTYGGVSGANFTSCNGAYGDETATAIAESDIGWQAAPASLLNLILATVIGGQVYRARAQSGLNVTAAPGRVFAGTTELAYAGGTLALTDAATNHVYLWNNGGTLTLESNTTSFANAYASRGQLWPLAKIVCAAGTWAESNYTDERLILKPMYVSTVTGDVVGPGSSTDNAIVRFDGTTGKLLQNSVWTISDVGNVQYDDTANIITFAPQTGYQSYQDGSTDPAGTFGVYTGGAPEANPRFDYTVSGAMRWGPGGATAPDTAMSRIAASVLGMASGDAFRVGDYAEFLEASGPSSPNSTFQRLWADAGLSTLKHKDDNGQEKYLSFLLWENYNDTDSCVSSASEETVTDSLTYIGDDTLATDWINLAGRSILIKAAGVWSVDNSGVPATCTVKVKYGSTVIGTCVLSQAPGGVITDAQWSLEVPLVVFTTGATGTIDVHGALMRQYRSDLGTYQLLGMEPTVDATVTVDLTAATPTFSITAQFTASSASNEFKVRKFSGLALN